MCELPYPLGHAGLPRELQHVANDVNISKRSLSDDFAQTFPT